VEYEDRITIPTPEGIELEYTLAGVGSSPSSSTLLSGSPYSVLCSGFSRPSAAGRSLPSR
jgi:hypothetical protein